MSTRCLTIVTSQWDNQERCHCATIYRHHDGYLDGQGQWLADFLADKKIVNGIGSDFNEKTDFNGPGRLAAGIVAALREDGHSPDLMPKNAECGQEFEYHVHCEYGPRGGTISIRILDGPMTAFGCGGEECTNEIFSGSVKKFQGFLKRGAKKDAAPAPDQTIAEEQAEQVRRTTAATIAADGKHVTIDGDLNDPDDYD